MTGTLKRLMEDQARGALPTDNAWMSASAGTGKTQVLTARILRLLLPGVEPGAILAITFTKAGASEMASRIRERLAMWVQLGDADLRKELHAIHAPGHFDEAVLRHARTLFARVIDAPGSGLAIQTIHSFCQTLLAAFPEEAGLAPGFRPLEEAEAQLLLRDTLTAAIADAPARGDMGFMRRIEAMALDIGEDRTCAYLYRCAAALPALDALPPIIGPWLRLQFGLQVDVAPDEWLEKACALTEQQEGVLHAVRTSLLRWGAPSGKKSAEVIDMWLRSGASERAQTLEALNRQFFTGKGGLLAIYSNHKQCGDVEREASAAGEMIRCMIETSAQMATADRMADALDAGRHFARAYAARKRADGVVDFDDLINRAAELLGSADDAEWIKYKLDARIDHVLVDEAQDTNAGQWAIINGLTQEYFSGFGARDPMTRTLFVVGDAKQAIYGFQGTSPDYFVASKGRFAELGRAAERPFADLSIATNFRSSRPVLAAVDALVASIGPHELGLVDDDRVLHHAHADDAMGRVTMWPLEPAGAVDGEQSGEDDDGDEDDAKENDGPETWLDQPTRRVADKIARTVRHWVDHGIDGEAVNPADVLVLVRKRSDLAALIVSRLQCHGVPVAGVDRLGLRAPLAVQDLVAAVRFALQPLDSLNLASLLVSPLFGWSHDDVVQHGWRGGSASRVPLWPHLRARVKAGALDVSRISGLYTILDMAGFVGPYRFFETILSGEMRGRAKLLSRLGEEARDPIEELLTQALAYETRDDGSLHGFIQWYDSADHLIKRELEAPLNEVRVMTVHGSKGLQGKIVILADAAHDPTARRSDSSFDWAPTPDDLPVPLLSVAKGPARPPTYAAQMDDRAAADLRESWRLLYVAMTRAERMLFVAGALSARAKNGKPHEDSWYAALEPVLSDLGAQWSTDDAIWGSHLSYAQAAQRRQPAAGKQRLPASSPVALPEWIDRPPPAEQRPPRPLSPSTQEDVAVLSVAQPPAAADELAASDRGVLMHALFERLPGVEAAGRTAVAERWLAARAPGLAAETRAAMVADVIRVLAAPEFAALFGPNSIAEVPFSALVEGRVIAGTIDRLLVDDAHVHIIDFKSGRHVPDSEKDVPTGYLKQMAAYAAAMAVIFPKRRITASLLFSGGPRLITLSDGIIAEHKPGYVEAK